MLFFVYADIGKITKSSIDETVYFLQFMKTSTHINPQYHINGTNPSAPDVLSTINRDRERNGCLYRQFNID